MLPERDDGICSIMIRFLRSIPSVMLRLTVISTAQTRGGSGGWVQPPVQTNRKTNQRQEKKSRAGDAEGVCFAWSGSGRALGISGLWILASRKVINH